MSSRKGKLAGVAAAALMLPAGCLIAVPALFAAPPPPAATACGGTPAVTVGTVPTGLLDGFYGEQLTNAAQIMRAGKDKGLSVRGQTIGVMTAIGESDLINIGHGDLVGPDSRGLFQQRNSWGPLAVRMDPYGAAGLFFDRLKAVPGWEFMQPTAAAHAVQANADPNYYAQFWDKAAKLVGDLAGVPVTVTAGAGSQTCTAPGPNVPVPAGGVVKPVTGVLTSGFSPHRVNPVTGVVEPHNGQDIGAACGTPIYAAMAGDVIKAGVSSGFGHAIFIDHGNGLVTWYGHEYANGVLVHVGDRVAAGQQIGLVGADGQATGCHLHFEVHVNGVAVDPVPWMIAHGAPLG